MDSHQRTLGELAHDAMIHAAQRKVEALRLKKLSERIYDRVFLTVEGKNLAEKEARARQHMQFIEAEDAALLAESEAIVAKAKADGVMVRFEEFRTKAATDRAEMQLR